MTAVDENADRRLVRDRMNRRHGQRAEGRCERGQHVGEAVRAPDQRQRAARAQEPRRGLDPGREQRPRRRMRQRARRIRRYALPGGIVERRIHQHRGDAVGRQTGGGEGARRRRDVEGDRTHPRRQAVEPDVLGGQRRELPDRSRPASPSSPGRAPPRARPAAPTPAPRSTTLSPRSRRAGGREQDRVVADAMPALGLAQPQPPAENRVFGDAVRAHCRFGVHHSLKFKL